VNGEMAAKRLGPALPHAFRLSLSLAVGVTVAGCIFYGNIRSPERVPAVIGIIATVEPGKSSGQTFALDDGRTIVIPSDAELLNGGAGAEPGDLMLAEIAGDEPWWITLRLYDDWQFIDRCFQLDTGYAEERHGQIVTEDGLVIDKAPNFDSGGVAHDGRYDDPRGTFFCLDEEGRALAAS
jgi:hypothetical protein